MKLIILLDNGTSIPEGVVEKIGRDRVWFVSTNTVIEDDEYDFLNNSIGGFLQTDKDVLIVKFSGREEIATKLGDECSEMLIYLTPNHHNTYYIEEYVRTFLDFIDIFTRRQINVRT